MVERIAVFTDVHADAPALHSILNAIEEAGISKIWCLGDFCSGGPDPRQCFDWTTANCEIVLAGNHELFVTHKVFMQYQGGWADAAYYAYQELGSKRLQELEKLSSYVRLPYAELIHGAMTDPASDYIRTDADAFMNLNMIRGNLLLFGHTHQAALYISQVKGLPKKPEIVIGQEYELPNNFRCALNPGAGCDNKGARWMELILDDDERNVMRRVIWHQTDVPGHGGMNSIF